MQKNTLLIGIGVVLVLAGILFFIFVPHTQAPGVDIPFLPSPEPSISQPPAPPPPATPPGHTPPPPPIAPTAVIIYTNSGFNPKTLTINRGESVIFKNESSENFWPASDAHPSHGEYPTKGGCLGSTFDACKRLPPGSSWLFTFDISGTWEYHDHLNSLAEGVIVVQ